MNWGMPYGVSKDDLISRCSLEPLAAALGDGSLGLVGVPARDGRDEAGVDLVPAAHLLRGGGVRGREDLEDPVPGTFGSGQAASVAVAWRYDGPRGPGR